MLVDLGLYRGVFENKLLTDTDDFYAKESTERMALMDSVEDAAATVAAFVAHISLRLKEEQERCSPSTGYLDLGSRKDLVSIVEKNLIKQNVGTLLSKGERFLRSR